MRGIELLEKSKELVNEIYESMSMIEKCEAIAEEIKDKKFVFIKKGATGQDDGIYLDDVISENQECNIRSIIVSSILRNKEDAEEKLNALLAKKPEVKEEDPETLKLEKGEELTKKEVKVTVERVRELYKENPEISQKEIARILGVRQSTISVFMKRHASEVRPS